MWFGEFLFFLFRALFFCLSGQKKKKKNKLLFSVYCCWSGHEKGSDCCLRHWAVPGRQSPVPVHCSPPPPPRACASCERGLHTRTRQLHRTAREAIPAREPEARRKCGLSGAPILDLQEWPETGVGGRGGALLSQPAGVPGTEGLTLWRGWRLRSTEQLAGSWHVVTSLPPRSLFCVSAKKSSH